jgi:hypothetical protein
MAERTCLRCSRPISGVTVRRQYCSAACKKSAKRDRERELQGRTGTFSETSERRSGTREGRTGTLIRRSGTRSSMFPGARMIPVAWDKDGEPTRWAPSYNPF